MLKFIKDYWVELLIFGVIFGVLLKNCAPSWTWINTDSDGIHYVYSAQYFFPSHKQSAPLFLLLGHLFLYIPLGTEFWRMALISVLSGTVCSIFIYLSIKQLTQNRWYGLIGALIYGGSALAMSQNTIVEAYPLITALGVASYYYCLKQKWLIAIILSGLAIAVHPTALLIVIPIFIGFKELRNWRRWTIILPFFLFYLYTPITNRPPYMWQSPKSEGGTWGFITDSISTINMLAGGLAMYDIPKRIFDACGLILLNFAVIGVYPLYLAFKGKKWYKSTLLWLVLVPILFYVSNLAPQTYCYIQPAIAFGAIAIGIGLTKVNKKIILATVACTIVLLGFNTYYFNIGTTLDKDLSATEYFTKELPKVPDNQILMPQYGWEWAAIYHYNKDNNRNIIPVCVDTLISPAYQKMLIEQGIKFEDNNNADRLIRQNYIAISIVNLNDNVWTTKTTIPETYGCEVVLAKDSMDSIDKIPNVIAGQWHWKPSNPYLIITGALEVREWNYITLSNHNFFFVLSFAIYGYGLVYAMFYFSNKRNKKHVVTKRNLDNKV